MKFLCHTEFVHGVRLYRSGDVYSDFTAGYAEELIALDTNKPLGALSFFTPVGDEAADFLKAVKRNATTEIPVTAPPTAGAGEGGDIPKQPTKAELVAEAKDLGIKGADRMSVDELKEVITATKTQTPITAPPTAGAGEGTGSAT
jgi:hypothetical protein